MTTQMTAPPAVTLTRVSVGNLNCAGCVSRAEKALSTAEGVARAQVNLASKTAEIWSQSPLDLGQLSPVMEQAGYPIAPFAPVDAPDQRHDPIAQEIHDARQATIIAALLTAPVFVVEMGGHIWPAFHHAMAGLFGQTPLRVMQFLLTSLVLVGPGRVFFRLGLPALRRGAPDMNALVVLGASAAFGFSALVTFAPEWVPQASRHVYFEAAAVIVTLILLGRYLEARARGQAGAAIARLMDLRPQMAARLTDHGDEEVGVEALALGDLIRLRPGEKVAADGQVVSGASEIDESLLTGEALPVTKQAGDDVTGGTINGSGALIYRVTALGRDSRLAQITRMVEAAQATRLPIQSLINRITAVFVPLVMVLALGAGAAWWIFGPSPIEAAIVTVSVLIIACPCAMGLATPVSIMAGTGRAAQLGVHFRNGAALQGLRDVDLVAFDKTGTLTAGRPALTGIALRDGHDENRILGLMAAVEQGSEHPFARALLAEAKARGLTLDPVTDFRAEIGGGVSGRVGDADIRIGTEDYLMRAQIPCPAVQDQGVDTIIHLAMDGAYIGHLRFADPIKPDAKQAVARLRAMGKEVALLSGDARAPVLDLAGSLGIDEAHFRLTPQDKMRLVAAWRVQGRKVAFVGDGVNDAPVLAEADIGLAVGTGSDIAKEAGDVVLATSSPMAVVAAMDLSRATMRNIAQNLFWAFGYNIALIPVAAGALAVFGGPHLNPMLAAGAMAASSVFVVMNALRLRHAGQAAGAGLP